MSTAAPVILLKSGWQVVNIGDIAHTPGMLALIERHLPQAQVRWWPIVCDARLEAIIRRRFPRVEILPPALRSPAAVDPSALAPWLEGCDLYLHGSGPNPMAVAQWRQWRELHGGPVVVGGITVPPWALRERELLDRAERLYCRDSHSLRLVQEAGIATGRTAFAPDAAFACDIRDDVWAEQFVHRHGLVPGGYCCFIGRRRYPPFHRMDQWYRETPEQVAAGEALNAATAEPDHAKLRAVITGWVRATGKVAVVCPEMIYQLDDADPLLVDRLPDDVRRRVVVVRDWWCTDQAVALYARARAVVSMKMHSPVLAQGQGVPSLHIRQQEDTAKGQMWRDLGLAEWLFEIDAIDGSEVLAALLAIEADPAAAQARVAATGRRIAAAHADMVRGIAGVIGAQPAL